MCLTAIALHPMRGCHIYSSNPATALPDECCTLSISPMASEMIQRLATCDPYYEAGSHTDLCARALLGELALIPKEALYLSISAHPKIRQIVDS